MTELADRLEHAIDQHTDVEQEIAEGERRSLTPAKIRRTAFWLGLTGVSLYLVAPSLTDVLSSWSDLDQLSPGWFGVLALLQTASLACVWALQRLALRRPPWYAVITSQLAGNALSKVAPGGGAMGAALQYKMLARAGIPTSVAVAGLSAANVLVFAMVLAMPLFAIPAIIRGGVDRNLLEIAAAGIVLFVAMAGVATVLFALDGPLLAVGRAAQRIRNAMRRKSPPLEHLPERLQRERDRLLGVLGEGWKRAVLVTSGRWAFDYATLLAALAAVGSTPRPSLVLLAFCAAQVLAQIPVTPGGLGFVEAGLTAMLALAGVSAGAAVLATFAYRLFSYWLPLPIGLIAYGWYARRLRI
jgi:uncharacterized protein (TIRG00374 family)